MLFVILVVLDVLSITYLYSLRVKQVDSLQPRFVQDSLRVTGDCYGHYYLCRFRDALTKSMWYNGQIDLQGDIHDFSSTSQFKTSVHIISGRIPYIFITES